MTKTIFGCLMVAGFLLATPLLHAADPTNTTGPTNPPTTTPPTTTSSLTIQTTKGPDGVFLTDSAGHSLYMFEIDNVGKSNCTGVCVKAWPPVTVADTHTPPTVAGDADSNMLSKPVTRDDGSIQVTYNDLPLYTFAGDKVAGDTKGQGMNAFGGHWYLVKPDGSKLMPSTSPAPRGR